MLLSAFRGFQLRLPTCFLNTRSYRSLSTMGAIGTQTVDTSDRLAALRKHMAEHNVDAYIVPSEDQRKSQGPSD
jgi:Xaa-Pro aminopeptidase